MTILPKTKNNDGSRYRYIQAKAEMLRRTVGLNKPPIPLDKILINQTILVKYIFDLQEMICIKYNGKNIIMFPPSSDRNRDRWNLARGIAHFYLRHFEFYAVNKIILGMPFEILTEYQADKLQKEADVFATQLLLPMNLFEKYLNENLEIDYIIEHINELTKVFQVPRDIVCKRMELASKRG